MYEEYSKQQKKYLNLTYIGLICEEVELGRFSDYYLPTWTQR
jgi:hypothetical protein